MKWFLLLLLCGGCGNDPALLLFAGGFGLQSEVIDLQDQVNDLQEQINEIETIPGPQGEQGIQGEPNSDSAIPEKIHICHCQPDRFNTAIQMVRECHTLFVDFSALTTHMTIHDHDYIGPCE